MALFDGFCNKKSVTGFDIKLCSQCLPFVNAVYILLCKKVCYNANIKV